MPDPLVNLWCVLHETGLFLGDGPAGGASLTTCGDTFLYSTGKTNIDADASMWLQSNADGGLVCDAGVKIGSPAGVMASAGGNVDIFAGCALSPSVGSPDGPGGAPTQASLPCADTAANVNRGNALNGFVKGVSDVAGGIQALSSADSAFDKASAGWDIAKGAWDMTKAGEDAGAYEMNSRAKNGIDGAVGAIDQVMSAAGGNVPNLVGAFQSGEKLGKAIAGEHGAEGSGGGAGGEGGGHGGGGEIVMKAPAGIKKYTDAAMEAFVADKIEYKAGTNIALNAANKVETVSMMFEAHANVQAAMKGLARAKVESFGKVTIDGKACFAVETLGTGEVKAHGALTVESGALLKIEGKGQVRVETPTFFLESKRSVIKADASMMLKSPLLKMNIDKTVISGKVEINELVTAKANVWVKGQLDVEKKLYVNDVVTCKDVCKFG